MLNNKKWIQQSLWFTALLGLLLTSLAISWQIQAKLHYGYSVWYDVYSIEQHIETFGPKNHFIKGLDTLTSAEHIRLFNEISEAVHHHGKGLGDIAFISSDSGNQQTLLRQPEIIHLQDVANLIDVLHTAAFIIAVITIVLWGVLPKFCKPVWNIQLKLLALVVGLTSLLVFVLGPKNVFYQLHIWIFPDNHQWFFYYQESLMSTLMKAPYLFGGIGAAIGVGGACIFVLFLWWDVFRTQRKSASVAAFAAHSNVKERSPTVSKKKRSK